MESSPSLLCLANSYSSYKVHPKFLLPLPKFSPVSLAESDTSSSEAPCSSLTSLNHWCLCPPLSWCLWGYGWSGHLFLPPSSHLFILLLGNCPKFPFGYHPIPSQARVFLDHLSQITYSLKRPDARWLCFLPWPPGPWDQLTDSSVRRVGTYWERSQNSQKAGSRISSDDKDPDNSLSLQPSGMANFNLLPYGWGKARFRKVKWFAPSGSANMLSPVLPDLRLHTSYYTREGTIRSWVMEMA